MSKFLVVVFPDEAKAYEGSHALKALHGEGNITLYGLAVVAKQSDGSITIKDAVDEGPVGTALGMLTGSLVGLLGGPAGVVLGATGGALLGSITDLSNVGVAADFLDEMSKRMQPGTVAVAAEIDEYWRAPVDTRLEALGGTVIRRPRVDVVDEQIEREVDAWNAEFNELKAEFNQATGEAKASLQAKIDETRVNLEGVRDRAKEKLDQLKAEIAAKIKELQDQSAKTSGEAKAKIEQRISEVRADYDARSAKLSQAWELTKEALVA